MATGGHDTGTSGFNTDSDVAMLTYFPNFYRIQFEYKPRGQALQRQVDNDFLVQLDSDKKKQKLKEISLAVTKLTLEKDCHVINAKHVKGTLTNDSVVDNWKKCIRDDIVKNGIKVFSWAVVHVGLKAEETKQEIDRRFSSQGLTCLLNQEQLVLLLLASQEQAEVILQAKEMAEKARPSKTLAVEFTTPNGIRVSVFHGDITLVPAECVVSAVDGQLSFSGGVSKKIEQAVGKPLKDACSRYMDEHHALPLTEMFVTGGGRHWKNVIHAHGPLWTNYRTDGDRDNCRQLLVDTVFNCLRKAAELGHRSIALPFISSGTFRVPPEVCAESYKLAIEKFDRDLQRGNLELILFVDVVHDKISEIQRGFQTSMEVGETLRIVLVGKTGVGKSMTGNSILDSTQFKVVEDSLAPVTEESSLRRVTRQGAVIEVVDTPGLFDEADNEERELHILKEIMKSITLFLPGPHVFLLVFSAKERFAKAEEEVCKKIKQLFADGKDNVLNFLIVVFTRVRNEEHLNKLLQGAPKPVTDLLAECSGRVVGINNGKAYCQQQADKLVETALELRARNGGQSAYYSNLLIQRILQLVQTDAGKTLNQIKKEVEHDETLLKKLLKDQQARTAAQQNRTNFACAIL